LIDLIKSFLQGTEHFAKSHYSKIWRVIKMAENTPAQGQSKGKSIACMACGIASIVLSWSYGCGLIPAIVSLVLGSQCAKEGVQNTFTKVGKITGIIGLILSIVLGVIMIIAVAAAAASGVSSY
jgi:hypothetical protein